MRDYYNDPPESPEPPACPADPPCPGAGEYLYDGKDGWVHSCDTCGYQWVIPYPVDPEPEPEQPADEQQIDEQSPGPCPHGNMGECDACDHASDIAYDSEREKRLN